MARLADLAEGWQGRLADPGPRLSEVLRLDGRQVAAEAGRMRGADVADDWAALADGWTALGRPFRDRYRPLARGRRGRARRAIAREPLRPCARAIAWPRLSEPHRSLGHLETMARRLRVRLAVSGSETDVGTRGDASPYGLTRRELEVLAAVAAGRTNRQIAEALFISESTAGVHVSNILGKLGVATRTEAAGVAIEQGLARPQ